MAAEDYIPDGFRSMYEDQPGGIIHFIELFEVIHETEKAIKVKTPDGVDWFPKSVSDICSPPFTDMSDHPTILIVESWFVESNPLDTEFKIYHWNG